MFVLCLAHFSSYRILPVQKSMSSKLTGFLCFKSQNYSPLCIYTVLYPVTHWWKLGLIPYFSCSYGKRGVQCGFSTLAPLFSFYTQEWADYSYDISIFNAFEDFHTMVAALSLATFLIWMSFNIVLFGNKQEFCF